MEDTKKVERGIRFEYEPEGDARNYVGFESSDDVPWDANGMIPRAWMLEQMRIVADDLSIDVADLEDVPDFWTPFLERIVENGFGVYDSDTRTEVYDRADWAPRGKLLLHCAECGDPLDELADADGDEWIFATLGLDAVLCSIHAFRAQAFEEGVRSASLVGATIQVERNGGMIEDAWVEFRNGTQVHLDIFVHDSEQIED